MTPAGLVAALLGYLPHYVTYVLIPAYIRLLVERFIIGIRHEEMYFVTLEYAYSSLAYLVLAFPLLEEIVFRGAPYSLFGPAGLALGSAVWAAVHPAWQMMHLPEGLTLAQRAGFLVTTLCFYISAAYFYSLLWLNGAGLLAVIYHMLHNALVTIPSLLGAASGRRRFWRRG